MLIASAGVGPAAIGVLLVVYGAGAVVGNIGAGRATDRFGSRTTLNVVAVGFVAGIAVFPFTATTAWGAGITLFTWSVFTWAFNPPLQNVLLELAPGGGLLLSLNASTLFLGAGLSGVVGGLVIETFGVLSLPPASAILGFVALALLLFGAGDRPSTTASR